MSSDVFYLEVVFKSPLDRSFVYFSPHLVSLYSRVVCSFGKRQLVGVVVGIHREFSSDYEIKEIISLVDETPLIDDKAFKLAKWISAFYHSSLGEALSLFLPFSILTVSSLKSEKTEFRAKSLKLNEEQESLFNKVISSEKMIFLLKGVTGSGKTYVYIKLIQYFKEQGQQTLLLLPEINLTPQIEEKLFEFFNQNDVAVVHSRISKQKKLNYFEAFREGKIKVMIGTRSAIFAIPKDLGLIILDEEHEDTFKNGAVPRYHTRQVAQMISKEYGAKLLLGSATPSVETYFQAMSGHIEMLNLTKRYYGANLPEPLLIEKHFDSDDVIDERIKELIEETKNEGKKSIIYINRRGYSSSVRCTDCKKIYLCPRCNVSFTFHKKKGIYLCHYCGGKGSDLEPCSVCASKKKEKMGAGVEKLEEEIKRKIQGIQILRLDRDAVTTEKKLKKALKDFSTGLYDTMIGTQILTKGHDFPDVKRVFVMYPENELTLADFRASQRTYDQLVQVSGRAGRRDEQGEVYVQSQMGDHYSIELGMKQNYEEFYAIEIERREIFNYPPFSRLFRFVIRGKEERLVIDCVREIKNYFLIKEESFYEVLGPSPCLFSKIKDNYRWNILFKIKSDVGLFLKKIDLFQKEFKYKRDKIYIEYDMDPSEVL